MQPSSTGHPSRRGVGLLLLACLVARTHGASAEATMVDAALRALGQRPPVAADCLDFAVIGDTRSTEPIVLPEEFRQAIREVNVLNPAFFVDIGDLILGGAAEGLAPQWDEFEKTVAACNVPFFPVPGNHDISDAATERIYIDRIGRTRYAFTYGNALFVMLNSEEIGTTDGLSPAQNAWLREQLEGSDARHVFVFLHKPFFAYGDGAGWAPTAEILRGHPVRVVFASHWHLYRDYGITEGVRYVVTGGGGAERSTPEDEGGFCHYLLVRVRGDDVGWAVIRPGAILPPDAVTNAELAEIRAIKASASTAPLEVGRAEGVDRDVTVMMRNPFKWPIESTIAWTIPDGWGVSPASAPYSIPPGETARFVFHVQADSPETARFPVPVLTTTLSQTSVGRPIEVAARLDLLPTLAAGPAAGPVTVDGDLGDWAHAQPIPLTYPFAFDVADTEDLEADIRLMWDPEYVYLAVEVEDDEFHQPYAGDIVWSADGVQLFLDEWEWGLTLTASGPEVFLYRGPGREGETVNAVVRLAVRRGGRRTVYEAAFPASEVAPLELAPGNSFRLCVVVNDLDPSVPDRPRHWLELTPGPGDGVPGAPTAKVVLAR